MSLFAFIENPGFAGNATAAGFPVEMQGAGGYVQCPADGCNHCLGPCCQHHAWDAFFHMLSHLQCAECGEWHNVEINNVLHNLEGMVVKNLWAMPFKRSLKDAQACCGVGKVFECTECGYTHNNEYDAKYCCPKYECSECGGGHYAEEDAQSCCQAQEECDEHCCCKGDRDTYEECCICGYRNYFSVPLSKRRNSPTAMEIPENMKFSNNKVMREYTEYGQQVVIAHDMADFYLLEYLGCVENYLPARQRLLKFEKVLAKEWQKYLSRAVGGELRHANKAVAPVDLLPFLYKAGGSERNYGWDVWDYVVKTYGPRAMDLAVEAFYSEELGAWPSSGYGGEKWGQVAKVTAAHMKGQLPDRIFIDRACSLEHNGGCVFNKAYETNCGTRYVLNAHNDGNIDALLRWASKPVQRLWTCWQFSKLADRTPEVRAAFNPALAEVTESEVETWHEEAESVRMVGVWDSFSPAGNWFIDEKEKNDYDNGRRSGGSDPRNYRRWYMKKLAA